MCLVRDPCFSEHPPGDSVLPGLRIWVGQKDYSFDTCLDNVFGAFMTWKHCNIEDGALKRGDVASVIDSILLRMYNIWIFCVFWLSLSVPWHDIGRDIFWDRVVAYPEHLILLVNNAGSYLCIRIWAPLRCSQRYEHVVIFPIDPICPWTQSLHLLVRSR